MGAQCMAEQVARLPREMVVGLEGPKSVRASKPKPKKQGTPEGSSDIQASGW